MRWWQYLDHQLKQACWIVAVIILLILPLLAPIIYEFKPVLCDPQYRIIKDGDGKIVGLKKDATGFHLPLDSESRFVNLAKEYRFKQLLRFSSSGWMIEIPYMVVCDNPEKVFIESNGKFACKKPSFASLAATSFKFMIMADLPAEEMQKFTAKPAELYEFVSKEAEKWSSISEYGCKIQIDKNSVKANPSLWIEY